MGQVVHANAPSVSAAHQVGGGPAAALRTALLFAIIISLPLVAVGVIDRSAPFLEDEAFWPLAIVRMSASVILAGLPLLISYVQSIARDRHLTLLNSVDSEPVARTAYYQAAHRHARDMRPVSLDRHYSMPMATLAVVLIAGFIIISFGPVGDSLLRHPSVLLGGTGVGSHGEELLPYQVTTFAAMSVAFLGGYIYTLFRLLERVNNDDIYPISFYYYSARIVIACLIAAVMRHAIAFLGVESSAMLLLLAFAIGFTPDLFIISMLRKAFQAVKIIGSQADPQQKYLPTNLSLLMIEGMTRDKVDRLNELGIDSAVMLSSQNPFVLWSRVPYDLPLILDWIGQAQLYRWCREEGVSALRRKQINNIFDLYLGLQDEGTSPEICTALGISRDAAPGYIANLESDPSFARLWEVRAALVPEATAKRGADARPPAPGQADPPQVAA